MKLFSPLFFSALVFLSSVSLHAEDAPKEAPKAPTVGDEAPDFTLKSAAGEDVTLSSFRGKKNVVLYFYPRDNTPGCTKEAQSFRDDAAAYEKAGAVVLGVSTDNEESHKFFAKKHELNFTLLADQGGKVARQYGAMGWIMAKRVTYVIGLDGKIKEFYGDVDTDKHSKEVLKLIQSIAPETPAEPVIVEKPAKKTTAKAKKKAKS